MSVEAPRGIASLVGKIIALPFHVVGGTAYGSVSAINNGGSTGLFASEVDDARRALAAGQEGAGVSLFKKISNFFDTHVGQGLTDIKASGVADDVAQIGEKGKLGEVFSKLFSPATEGGVGARGLGLIATRVLASAGLAVFGFRTFIGSYKKFSQAMKGHSTLDNTRSPVIHGLKALGGLAMTVGGVLAFPGLTAALGIGGAFGFPLALAGLGLYGATALVQYSLYGFHMFNYPDDKAIWPFSMFMSDSARTYRSAPTLYG